MSTIAPPTYPFTPDYIVLTPPGKVLAEKITRWELMCRSLQDAVACHRKRFSEYWTPKPPLRKKLPSCWKSDLDSRPKLDPLRRKLSKTVGIGQKVSGKGRTLTCKI